MAYSPFPFWSVRVCLLALLSIQQLQANQRMLQHATEYLRNQMQYLPDLVGHPPSLEFLKTSRIAREQPVMKNSITIFAPNFPAQKEPNSQYAYQKRLLAKPRTY